MEARGSQVSVYSQTSLFTAIYLSNEIRARHVAMRHAIGRVQAWEGGHAYVVFNCSSGVRTLPVMSTA
jgi:hypothetical protein